MRQNEIKKRRKKKRWRRQKYREWKEKKIKSHRFTQNSHHSLWCDGFLEINKMYWRKLHSKCGLESMWSTFIWILFGVSLFWGKYFRCGEFRHFRHTFTHARSHKHTHFDRLHAYTKLCLIWSIRLEIRCMEDPMWRCVANYQ